MSNIGIVNNSDAGFAHALILIIPWINFALVIYAITYLIKKKLKAQMTVLWILFVLLVPIIGPVISIIILKKCRT